MQKIPYRFLFGLLALFIISTSAYNTFIIARQTSDENLYANQEQGVVLIQITPGGVSDDAGLRVGGGHEAEKKDENGKEKSFGHRIGGNSGSSGARIVRTYSVIR